MNPVVTFFSSLCPVVSFRVHKYVQHRMFCGTTSQGRGFQPGVFEHFSLRIWPIFLSHHEFAQTSEERVSLCGGGLFVKRGGEKRRMKSQVMSDRRRGEVVEGAPNRYNYCPFHLSFN